MLLTVKEAALHLKMHPNTVYDWAKEGKIPSIKLNGQVRLDQDDLDNFIKLNKHEVFNPNPLPSNIGISLEGYDKLYLKGGRNPVGNKTRWRYGFGIVYFRKTKQGNVRWYIEYKSGSVRQREVVENAQSREEAVLALKRRVAEIFDGKFNANRAPERILFSQLAEKYLDEYARPQKKSWKSDESRLRNLVRELGSTEIGRITDTMILHYRERRLGMSTSKLTTNREMALLKKMFTFAIEKGLMTCNPVKKIKMFSELATARTRVLSEEEERRLFAELAQHLHFTVLFALHTGFRFDEIRELEWSDVDMERGKVKAEDTKNGKVRFVPINSVIRPILEGMSLGKKRVGRVFGFKSVRTGFENACRRAGIEDFVFHDLRRTFGTRLLERGVDIVTISRLYGHSSVLQTQRYLHPRDEIGQEAVERLTRPESLSHICHTAA